MIKKDTSGNRRSVSARKSFAAPSASLVFWRIFLCSLFISTGCASSRQSSDSDEQDQIKKQGIAGAASQSDNWKDAVSDNETNTQSTSTAEELLIGNIAGVQVIELPNGGISVQIRGTSSLTGSSEPLYVVDGMPVQNRNGEGLSWLNIRDISKIEVLKDINAKALYGVRGANGVVLITTKIGQKDDDQ